jgi:hypothetical protein
MLCQSKDKRDGTIKGFAPFSPFFIFWGHGRSQGDGRPDRFPAAGQ